MSAASVAPRPYVRTFAALLTLLALTVGTSFFHLGALALPVSMLISVLKALLIILFFMEVRSSRRLIWLAAAAGFVWLALLLIMLMSDYTTRSWTGPDWRDGNGGKNRIEFALPR